MASPAFVRSGFAAALRMLVVPSVESAYHAGLFPRADDEGGSKRRQRDR
jgi:hypothetical protein